MRAHSQIPLALNSIASEPQWHHGAQFAFRGEILTLVFGKNVRRTHLSKPLARNNSKELCLSLPPEASTNQIRDAVQIYLQRAAHILIARTIKKLSAEYALPTPSFRLSFSSSNHWVRCDHAGILRLHWRVVEWPASVLTNALRSTIAMLAYERNPYYLSTELFTQLQTNIVAMPCRSAKKSSRSRKQLAR